MEPFYTKALTGGIGLAIVKKLVEQNGGLMEMASACRGGTCVKADIYRRGGRLWKILVVDDEFLIRSHWRKG